MKLLLYIRRFLWRILGVDYNHILKVVDYVYLKEDKFTSMGHKSYCNNALVFRWSDAPITVGRYCAIADGVRFIVDEGKHITGGVSSYPFAANEIGFKRGITIGNDVWIGQDVIILPGVNIGDGVTIAAGSVVNKDIPAYCIAAGVPVKVVKHKCTEYETQQMLKIAWWKWSDEKIIASQQEFKLSIKDFVAIYKIDD